jgi:hypothetical protein
MPFPKDKPILKSKAKLVSALPQFSTFRNARWYKEERKIYNLCHPGSN